LPGYQEKFLSAKWCFELLGEGTRGGGKTDTLIMDFYSDVGKGYGADWHGILFRQHHADLKDVVRKSKKIFLKACPDAKFKDSSPKCWTFPGGEKLYFSQFERLSDYDKHHGNEIPWIGWEELTNWSDDKGYKKMMSTCRSSNPEVAKIKRVRATTNPHGLGHNWVKQRFNLSASRGKPQLNLVDIDTGAKIPSRMALFSDLSENKILLDADPNYRDTIAMSAVSEQQRKAWLEGDWDIVAGGMFDDIWKPKHHVVKPFDIPHSWRIDRSFDWGSSAPFSVGWWAESDGSDVRLKDGTYRSTVRGDLFRINEWYGWNGKPNEGLTMLAVDIAKEIVEREIKMGIYDRCKAGAADTSIFNVENGNCIADDMAKRVRLADGLEYRGVTFTKADKSAGSRKTGWEAMRKMLKYAVQGNLPRENAGLFVFDNCVQFLRTIPVLPRCEKDMDDVDTKAEDHIADEVRYRVRASGKIFSVEEVRGMV